MIRDFNDDLSSLSSTRAERIKRTSKYFIYQLFIDNYLQNSIQNILLFNLTLRSVIPLFNFIESRIDSILQRTNHNGQLFSSLRIQN